MRKIIAVVLVVLAGCTENQRARGWGGESMVRLPPGRKLINATWKEADLWVLTRPAEAGEKPERFHFEEHSNWGVLEGRMVIQEVAR